MVQVCVKLSCLVIQVDFSHTYPYSMALFFCQRVELWKILLLKIVFLKIEGRPISWTPHYRVSGSPRRHVLPSCLSNTASLVMFGKADDLSAPACNTT